MNDDLISRSALKEDFKSRLARCDDWIEKAKDEETRIRADATKHFICEVIMTINNAPTVEPYQGEECMNIKMSKEEVKQFTQMLQEHTHLYSNIFVEDAGAERQQCNWIFDSEYTAFGNPYGTYKCSCCGGHSSNKYSFCKDCGAAMICEDDVKNAE